MNEIATTPQLESPRRKEAAIRVGTVLFFLFLAWFQLGPMVNGSGEPGRWFLYGGDTVSHDLPVQWWLWNEARQTGVLPLWMDPVRGGLPTVGAFLWAPLSPSLWLYGVIDTPFAQRAQFIFALWLAGAGGFWLARVLGMARAVALLVGIGVCLSGHLVTLIHAGHLQKVLALAWLPWFAGGMLQAIASTSVPHVRTRGIAIAGLSLGMAFLSGHPQVAYMMAGLAGLRMIFEVARSGGRTRILPMASFAGLLGLGLIVGAFQLLPGTEMSRDSNRAGGVEWDEAVATSYPIQELPEFFLPRFMGDDSATGWGEYHGTWGDERIVSDYAGILVVALAVLAIASTKKRELAFWATAFVLSIIVGLGDNTPVYRMLYNWLPGMNSFRSPGTFFAIAALCIPVLAGMGIEWLIGEGAEPKRHKRAGLILAAAAGTFIIAAFIVPVVAEQAAPARHALLRSSFILIPAAALVIAASIRGARLLTTVPIIIAGITVLDLAQANRAFLRAEPWDAYQLYMEPTPLDLWAFSQEPVPRVHEIGREASLRPVFSGRESLLAYHPIEYAAYAERIAETEFGTPEWRDAFGVNHIWVAGLDEQPPAPFEVAQVLGGGRGGVVVRDTTVEGIVRSGQMLEHAWLPTNHANERALRVTMFQGGELTHLRTIAPGWEWWIEGAEDRARIEAVALEQTIPLHSGTSIIRWEYRPASIRQGLFITMLGLGLVCLLLVSSRRIRIRPD